SLEQAEAHARTTLAVHELVADDEPVRRALLAAVGRQGDQVAEVLLDVDDRDPLPRALVDMDGARPGTATLEHTPGALAAGPMLRLVDVARALLARRYGAEGAFVVRLEEAAPSPPRAGRLDDAAARTFRLVLRDGAASVEPAAGPPDLTLGARALAA